MQSLITCTLILALISACFGSNDTSYYNVIDFGAVGDGKTDDSPDATFSRINVTVPADSPNTDGIDVSFSKNIFIQDSSMQTGDDCIAISGGSSSVNVTGIACGPGHGISIGSLGKRKDTVEGVHVRNCSLTKTKYGARIKTFPVGNGSGLQPPSVWMSTFKLKLYT